jgi:hypothetical protein
MQWGRSLYPRPRKIDSRGSEDRASSPTESSRAFWRLAATLPAGRRKTPQQTPQARFELPPTVSSAPLPLERHRRWRVPPAGPLDPMGRWWLTPILPSGWGQLEKCGCHTVLLTPQKSGSGAPAMPNTFLRQAWCIRYQPTGA